MAVVDIFNQQRQIVGEITLDPDVFEIEARPEILHLVVRSHLAAKRSGTVGVKTRSTIRGGGRKPWRQKGTGRARAGSNRSPIWRSGAVTHGPMARDYSFKVNKKVQKLAMRMALSSRLADKDLTVVEEFQLDQIKTKQVSEFIQRFDLKNVLIVVSEVDTNLALSSRNIPGVSVQTADGVNVYEMLRHHHVMVSSAAVESFQMRLK
ncbi:large subunit ribosomal protein L4 [Desulfonatronum thiosulfatophilum]|uniref:Large ribosomal subunit protein uL4 n=1 Tax=Desulfonatronum thiosulfatophilum TaxID=617002 RepID=A0A1G6BM06_9BACT|nr:50S ribosomal protein L4 [Desulfonatronum thiosulfatophilum]SDB21617.1 large subunit ribosomal protein L4 [Desulfonatronum thiosulfatophilum]